MGLQSAFVTAVSGINSTGLALGEIGNNIANVGTTAYKSRRVSFGDLFGATIGAGGVSTSLQEGRGVTVLGIDKNFTQGSLATTSNALDIAIDGDGFFRVQDEDGSNFFTRAGNFSLDDTGNIVTETGMFLQGFQADSNGNILGTVDNLVMTTTQVPAMASTMMDMSGNLDATSLAQTFSIADPGGTSAYSTGVRFYDSLGTAHDVTLYFTKTAANTWRYSVVASASEVTVDASALSGTNAMIASGTLGFTTNGALDTESAVTYYNASSGAGAGIDFTGGATANQAIAFDFGTSITTDSGTGLDGVQQSGSQSETLTMAQDGFASGTLAGISINDNGIITGRFSNGTNRSIGQLALSRFVNPDGLGAIGRNLFLETADSGQPVEGQPGSGALGRTVANTLELSNVDLGNELVNMITMQRAFQANSRVITSTDEMLTELVNLTR